MARKNDMEETIQTIKGDNESLMKEITSLKRQIGGMKTSNANYRKQVDELKARVEHYKALDIEGDHLYEEKIAEIESLRKAYDDEFAEKKRVIDGLSAQVHELIQKKNDLETKVSLNDEYIKELEMTVDDMRRPWWKKLF